MSFLGIEQVVIPSSCVDSMHDHLARMGRRGLEAFALWAGRAEGNVFRVHSTIIPEQTAHRLEQGVWVEVDGLELHRINLELYRTGLTAVAQIHSHPARAFHSDTDDAYPLVTTFGAFSLVIPDFARRRFDLAKTAVFRLLPEAGWVLLDSQQTTRLFRIED